MGKKIKHMGMSITEAEHERWHKAHAKITPEQHRAMMKKMGISEEENKQWHKTHVDPQKTPGQVNPFAIGGGFLNYCVKQGWLIQEGRGRNARYYVTEEGRKEIKKFGIKI